MFDDGIDTIATVPGGGVVAIQAKQNSASAWVRESSFAKPLSIQWMTEGQGKTAVLAQILHQLRNERVSAVTPDFVVLDGFDFLCEAHQVTYRGLRKCRGSASRHAPGRSEIASCRNFARSQSL